MLVLFVNTSAIASHACVWKCQSKSVSSAYLCVLYCCLFQMYVNESSHLFLFYGVVPEEVRFGA